MLEAVSQLDLPAVDVLPGDPVAATSAYVVGPENALLSAALEGLLENDALAPAAERFNPLTLVGPVGSGKTHLAQALVRRWSRLVDFNAVRYVTAVDFGREVQARHDENQLAAWRQEIRRMKLLVIDDLEQLRPRRTIERELRTTIDELVAAGAVVVATATQEPTLLRTIDSGVCDRLAAGLIVRIRPPEFAARHELIERAAAGRRLAATTQRIAELAHGANGPAAQVIGATAELIDLPLARRKTHDVPLKEIAAVAARYFGLRQSAIAGPLRRKSLVYARGMIVHLARTLTGASYAKIGAALGNRDHSTILHAHRQIQRQMSDDPNKLADYDELLRILQAT